MLRMPCTEPSIPLLSVAARLFTAAPAQPLPPAQPSWPRPTSSLSSKRCPQSPPQPPTFTVAPRLRQLPTSDPTLLFLLLLPLIIEFVVTILPSRILLTGCRRGRRARPLAAFATAPGARRRRVLLGGGHGTIPAASAAAHAAAAAAAAPPAAAAAVAAVTRGGAFCTACACQGGLSPSRQLCQHSFLLLRLELLR
eukprot:1146314-Pelagomonas_calceolata.AAC.3